MDTESVVSCPNCKTPVQWEERSPWRPFCSERCKLIDLGAWFEERHSIPGEAEMLDDPTNTSKN
ncbi:MAG: DNA gyrase inhibitor YacG [Gammaproteobacteria bacterium]|nr:DNA gyrase inhibitor YacG [Gammaproteobacteria bacterium]